MGSDRWNHFIFVLFYIFHIPQFKVMTHLLISITWGWNHQFYATKLNLKLCDYSLLYEEQDMEIKVRKLDLFSDHSVGTFSHLLLKQQFSNTVYDQHNQPKGWHYSVPNSWSVFKISILTIYSRPSKLFSWQIFNCLSDRQLWSLSSGWL